MYRFVDHQVKAGEIKRVLHVLPVEHDGPLFPTLAGLHHRPGVHQAEVVLPFIFHNKRRRVEQDLIETVKALGAQFQHRQSEQQGNTRLHLRGQYQPLQWDDTFLLQDLPGNDDQPLLFPLIQRREQGNCQCVLPLGKRLRLRLMRFPRPFNHHVARKVVT
ncbi:hypothetical protein D3C80_1479110 [compost metagenome]